MDEDLDEDENFRRNYMRVDRARIAAMLVGLVVILALLALFGR